MKELKKWLKQKISESNKKGKRWGADLGKMLFYAERDAYKAVLNKMEQEEACLSS
jgi:hypothetical protein